MAHRESTAERYYRVFEKRRSSVKVPHALHRIMRNAEKCYEERLKENVEDPLQPGYDSCDIISPTEATARSKPDVFSPIQVQFLLHLFQDMINGATISKPVIMQRVRKDNRVRKCKPTSQLKRW